MRKAKPKDSDELRTEYKRSDFGTLVRGKYAARIAVADKSGGSRSKSAALQAGLSRC
jgi:hypothetical protein